VSAVRVKIEEALSPAGTVTGLGRLSETPAGAAPLQNAERLTIDSKLSIDESTIVADCDVLGARVKVMVPGEG